MTKHTPGPWGLEGTEEFGYGIVEGRPAPPIADHVRGLANARLIAQAPAMLQVLRGCVAYFENMRHSGLTRDAAPDAQWLAPIKAILRAVDGE